MYLIVGLGNPGEKYADTRHNFGFKVLDMLADNQPWDKKYNSEFLKLSDVILLKPQTYMNNSGKAVSEALKFYPAATLIVVHDELDFPLGSMKVVKNSSPAGHNGVKSIIDEIGTQDFIRVRLGINSETRGQIPAEDFVLKDFTTEEQPIVKEIIEKAVQAVDMIQREPLDLVQSRFNG